MSKPNIYKTLIAGLAILGLALFGSVYSNKNPIQENLLETKVENKVLKDRYEKKLMIAPLVNYFRELKDAKEQPRDSGIYGYIEDRGEDRLDEYLAENCNGKCLYYPDGDGYIRRESEPGVIRDYYLGCIGDLKGDGWTLLDNEGNLVAWGKNKKNGSYPDSREFFDDSCKDDPASKWRFE